MLHAAANGVLRLDEINPWHFRAPVAPLLAARQERKRVRLAEVLAHIRVMQERFDILLVEGAGGLLSPLGEDFNSRDLVESLSARPIIVCPNRLGVLNQILLTLEALPSRAAARARVVFMSPPQPDASTRTNARLLAEQFDGKRIFLLPWSGRHFDLKRAAKDFRVRRMLGAMEQFIFQ